MATKATVKQDQEIATYTTEVSIDGVDKSVHVGTQKVSVGAISGELILDTKKWTPSAKTQTLDVHVHFPGAYTVTVSSAASSWLKVRGSETASFALMVKENATGMDRSATVTVTPKLGLPEFITANTKTISVKQLKAVANALEPAAVSIAAAGGLVKVELHTKGRWNASCLSDWTVLRKKVETPEETTLIVLKSTGAEGDTYSYFLPKDEFDGTNPEVLVAAAAPVEFTENIEELYAEGTAIGSTAYKTVTTTVAVATYPICYNGIGDADIYIDAKPNTTGHPRQSRLFVRQNNGVDLIASVTQAKADD